MGVMHEGRYLVDDPGPDTNEGGAVKRAARIGPKRALSPSGGMELPLGAPRFAGAGVL